MALVFLLALQAAAPPPALGAIDFDLARVRPAEFGLDGAGRTRGCDRADSSTIVVCGRRPSGVGYPLQEWARIFEPRPIVAETRLTGNLSGRAYVESVAFPNGEISNRVMVGVKLPF